MHIGQTTALQTRTEPGQALGVRVECIKASSRAHQSAERQSFAARAGAEIDHHFAAARRHETRNQLAAFILHFDRAALI